MPEQPKLENDPRRRLTTVIAADICGYSRLAEVDENAAIKTVELVFAAFEKVVIAHHGRVFNRAGDGFLAEFPSVVEGVNAAKVFIRDVKARDTLSPNSPNAKVRVGVHVGDVSEMPNGDLLGHGVNIASRLQNEAEPNGLLISLHTFNHIKEKIDTQFRRRGPMALKNIDEPIIAFDMIAGTAANRVLENSWARLRRINLGTIISGFALVVIVVVNLMIFTTVRKTDSKANLAEKTERQNSTIQNGMENSSSGRFFAPDADALGQIVSIENAIPQLLNSGHKKAAESADLFTRNLMPECSATIEAFYKSSEFSMLEKNTKSKLFNQMGTLLFYTNSPKAIELYRNAVDLDPNNLVALYQLAQLFYRTDRVERAFSYFTSVMNKTDDYSSLNVRARLGIAKSNLKLVSRRQRDVIDHQKADTEFQAIQNTLEILLIDTRKNNMTKERVEVLNQLAIVADYRENEALAVEFQKEAVSLETSLGRSPRLVQAIADLGAIAMEAEFKKNGHEGNFTFAESKLQDALALSHELNDVRSRSDVYVNLGFLFQYQLKYALSSDWFEEALRLSIKQDRKRSIQTSLTMLSQNSEYSGESDFDNCTILRNAVDASFENSNDDAPKLFPYSEYDCDQMQ